MVKHNRFGQTCAPKNKYLNNVKKLNCNQRKNIFYWKLTSWSVSLNTHSSTGIKKSHRNGNHNYTILNVLLTNYALGTSCKS